MLIDAWDELLGYIREKRVVPIIGPELLIVRDETGAEVPLYRMLARRAAKELGVDMSGLDSERAVYDVTGRYLLGRDERSRKQLYLFINKMLEDIIGREDRPPLKVEIPSSLKKLAAIREFRLFITVSCDGLLRQALEDARPSTPLVQLAYGPNARESTGDIPPDLDLSTRTVVYHLLGRRAASPSYVVTEEDLLEFLCAMQDTKRRPQHLFELLKDQNLLIIGTGLSDWLARFFIRTAKGQRLSDQRASAKEFMVDDLISREPDLVTFLKSFSRDTEMFPEYESVKFVDELYKRYMESGGSGDGGDVAPAADDLQMEKGAVFISYASEDRPFAAAIADALSSANVSVWLDRKQLEGADDYDLKIRRNIKNCSLFIPLISKTTQRRITNSYFQREWKLAVQRADFEADGVPFLIPTALDDTPSSDDANVPAKFLDIHWMRLANGKVSDEYVAHVNKLFRFHLSRRERALA